jgi:RND family efflux transporter MFP subunit
MSSYLTFSASVPALAVALLLAACEAKTDIAPQADRPVQVQRVRYETPVTAREYVGVVRARHDSNLGFRVAGKIVKRPANVGDRVHAGQVLAEIDASDLRLQVDSAEAELIAAKANLEQVAAEFDRYTVLKARGFASAADYDRKSAATGEAEGRYARAARALDLARKQLSYADLVAVSDGVITAANVEPGQVVAVGQPVAKLAHGEKEALVAIPENRLRRISSSEATITLWSESGRTYAARLRELSPEADPATRTYAARFSFLDADDDVALGMTATVTLRHHDEAPVARLPLSAVLNQGAGASVFVVDEASQLRLRPVSIAAYNEKSALITAGLANGETVVTLGVQKLEAGLKVRGVEGM